MAEYEPLLQHCAALGLSRAAVLEAVHLAGCRTADHVLETLQRAERGRWSVHYSALHHGRPYYVDADSGASSWDEPDGLRLQAGRIDCATFGLAAPACGALLASLAELSRAAADAWPQARDTAAKLLSNVLDRPGEPKFRRLNGGNERLNAALLRHRGAAALLAACGWQAAADGAWLFPDDCDTGRARCALARLRDAQALTDDTGASSAAGGVRPMAHDDPAQLEAMRRWQRGRLYRCDACARLVNDGSERAWTGRWDAPAGQFRYECSCGALLCESCFDAKAAPKKTHDAGGAGHGWTPRPPVTSRLQASGAGGESEGNPWGRFGASVSSRSRERLKDRTGM